MPNDSNNEVQNVMFSEKSPFKFKSTIAIGFVDYKELSLLDRNTLTYVCGYLMKKRLEKHSCEYVCINYTKLKKILRLIIFIFILYRPIKKLNFW